MTVGPQTRKFEIVFDWFDQTGDGWLTRSDFEKMAEMFKALAADDDEANKTAMEKAFMFWWDTLAGGRRRRARRQDRTPAVHRHHVLERDRATRPSRTRSAGSQTG